MVISKSAYSVAGKIEKIELRDELNIQIGHISGGLDHTEESES